MPIRQHIKDALPSALRSGRSLGERPRSARPTLTRHSDVEAEKVLLELHADEANQRAFDRKSPLHAEFMDLLSRMPDEAVRRCRLALDGGMVFREDGSAVDMRSILFTSDLTPLEQRRILARLHEACPAPAPEHRGLVVLSDVDDTLLPGADALKMSGQDRSWHRDGSLYPGVVRLHHELRRGLRDADGGDYSVVLTARPPALARSLREKLTRLLSPQTPRMGILPGAGGASMATNALRVLAGDYKKLGDVKLARFKEYALVFPDCIGRFVFIGDDGQADLLAAEQMLELRPINLPDFGLLLRNRFAGPVVAFVAIKAVKRNAGSTAVSSVNRSEVVQKMRTRFPAATEALATVANPAGAPRHRFFYFDDYLDLAVQLTEAGWMDEEQCDAVRRSVMLASVRLCDLVGLKWALNFQSRPATAGSEAEAEELEMISSANEYLPVIYGCHAHIQPAPLGSTTLCISLDSISYGRRQGVWRRDYWARNPGKSPDACLTPSTCTGATSLSPAPAFMIDSAVSLADLGEPGDGTSSPRYLSPGPSAIDFSGSPSQRQSSSWFSPRSEVAGPERASEKERTALRAFLWDCSTSTSGACSGLELRVEADKQAVITVPWPCPLFAKGCRPALDLSMGPHASRIFLLMADGEFGEDGEAEQEFNLSMVKLEAHGPDPSQVCGQVTVRTTFGQLSVESLEACKPLVEEKSEVGLALELEMAQL